MSHSKIDVEAVLADLGLFAEKRRGQWIDMACPFHPESNPSFSIHVESGFWIDRHNGARGPLVALVSHVKGVGDDEASEWVKRQERQSEASGDVLDKIFPKPEEAVELISEDAAWYQVRYKAADPDRMSEYWFTRGFTVETMRKFGVRFIDDEMGQCLMWPRYDKGGIKVLSWGLRKIPPFNGSKYLFPAKIPSFLYPINWWEGPRMIICEGPLDAIWLHQCGYPDAVSMLGTNMSRMVEAAIVSWTPAVTLAMDADDAGRLATAIIVKKLKVHGVDIKVLGDVRSYELRDGAEGPPKDIQDLSPSGVAQALQNAKPAWMVNSV